MPHIKRYLIPKFWPMNKKADVFAVRPSPGPHKTLESIPLAVVLRNILGLAQDMKEVRSILNSGFVTVDKKVRKDPGFPTGLMDLVELVPTKQAYLVTVSKSGLALSKVKPDEASSKLCKITGKRSLKGGITQLNLHDGRNILLRKDSYSRGDSVRISLPKQEIKGHFKLEPGSRAMIIAGKNLGTVGRIKSIEKRKTLLEKSTVVLAHGGREIKTLLDYIFPGDFELPEKPKPSKPEKAKREKPSRKKTKK